MTFLLPSLSRVTRRRTQQKEQVFCCYRNTRVLSQRGGAPGQRCMCFIRGRRGVLWVMLLIFPVVSACSTCVSQAGTGLARCVSQHRETLGCSSCRYECRENLSCGSWFWGRFWLPRFVSPAREHCALPAATVPWACWAGPRNSLFGGCRSPPWEGASM